MQSSKVWDLETFLTFEFVQHCCISLITTCLLCTVKFLLIQVFFAKTFIGENSIVVKILYWHKTGITEQKKKKKETHIKSSRA